MRFIDDSPFLQISLCPSFNHIARNIAGDDEEHREALVTGMKSQSAGCLRLLCIPGLNLPLAIRIPTFLTFLIASFQLFQPADGIPLVGNDLRLPNEGD